MAGVLTDAIYEREHETDILRQALAQATDGTGRVVLVRGAAGLGKTRLLTETRWLAEADGLRVLRTRGVELERDLAFSAIATLMRPAFGPRGTAVPEGPARVLLGLEHAEPLPAAPSYDLLDALYWLFDELCEDGPVAAIVDDAQWLDAPSLRALAYLSRRVAGLPLVLVVAHRDTEPATDDAALAQIEETDDGAVLTMARLSREASGHLAAGLGAPTLTEHELDVLEVVTRGNPLLVRQAVHDLLGSGRERALAGDGLSVTVRRRLDAASSDAGAVAHAVAILGDGAPIAHVAGVAGLTAVQVVTAGSELAALGLFTLDEPLTFAHPLLAEAVAAGDNANAAAAAHLRAAHVLRDLHADASHIAAQLLRSPPTGDARAVDDLREAARQALSAAAHETAAKLLLRALEEPPAPDVVDRVRIDCGTAQLAAGDPVGARGNLEFALTDPGLPVADAMSAGAAIAGTGAIDESIDAMAATSRLWQATRPDDALLLLGVTESFNWYLPAGEKRDLPIPPAEEIAGVTDGERAALLGLTTFRLKLPGAKASVLRDAAVRGLAGGAFYRPDLVAHAAGSIFNLCMTDDLEQADREVAALERQDRGAWRGVTTVTAIPRIFSHLLSGRTAAGLAELSTILLPLNQSAFVGPVGGGILASWIHASMLDALLDHDGPEAADRHLTEHGLRGELGPAGDAMLCSRAHVHLANGRPEEAWEDARAHGAFMRGVGDPIASPPYHSIEALALVALNRHEAAKAFAVRELDRSRAWGAPSHIAAHLRVLARADPSVAEEALTEAMSLVETTPVRPERVRTLFDLGVFRRAAGKRTEARELLQRAAQEATETQMHAVARQAVAELRILGAKPRRMAFSGVEALTASERRVADLAAQGATNRDIGRELWVTPKTAEAHLSRVYRKLGITSRRDLPDALRANL